MKILLLGATGRTGSLVLKTAISEGYQVHCLARNVERIHKQEGVSRFEGDASDHTDLERAMDGCSYVINTLNISRKSDFPWSGLRTPKNYLSQVMGQLVSLAEQKSIERIIICSAWGVGETKEDIPGWFKWFIDHSNIGAAYREHENQEQLLIGSKVKWTIVRPVGLTNSKKKEEIRETFGKIPKPGLTISRLSVARYLVDSIKRKDLTAKKVAISAV